MYLSEWSSNTIHSSVSSTNDDDIQVSGIKGRQVIVTYNNRKQDWIHSKALQYASSDGIRTCASEISKFVSHIKRYGDCFEKYLGTQGLSMFYSSFRVHFICISIYLPISLFWQVSKNCMAKWIPSKSRPAMKTGIQQSRKQNKQKQCNYETEHGDCSRKS